LTIQTRTYTPFVEVGAGVKLYVEDTCSGRAGTLVFIAGWPVASKIFEYQFQNLVPHGYRCIGIDMRGFGNSDKPWSEYNYSVFASDIKKVLDALDVENVVLIGHSMGAAISLHYCATQADSRLAKLVLVSPAAPCFSKRDDFPFGVERAVVDGMIAGCLTDRVKLLAKFGESIFAKPVSPSFARYFHSIAMAASPYATLKCLEALRDTDLRSDMAKVRVRTLIIHGGQDVITPFDLAEVLHRGINDSQLVRFENSGHGVFYEDLADFNRSLMEFASS
jgi:non-heme chloroperoxidase